MHLPYRRHLRLGSACQPSRWSRAHRFPLRDLNVRGRDFGWSRSGICSGRWTSRSASSGASPPRSMYGSPKNSSIVPCVKYTWSHRVRWRCSAIVPRTSGNSFVSAKFRGIPRICSCVRGRGCSGVAGQFQRKSSHSMRTIFPFGPSLDVSCVSNDDHFDVPIRILLRIHFEWSQLDRFLFAAILEWDV